MSSEHRSGTSHRWRVGALRELLARPLYHTLKGSSGFPGELLFGRPSEHIDALMSRRLQAAFTAPIDYAQNSSGMALFPGTGVSSSGESGTVKLFLRNDVHSISSMAVGNVSATDVVLARIILGEKYESEPLLVPSLGTVDEMLAKADCALLSGEILLAEHYHHPFIDIVDEWTDLTDLPFVHAVCMTQSESFDKELDSILAASCTSGSESLYDVARDISPDSINSEEILHRYLSRFSYGFDETARQSLEEFFTMAFYHGMLGDVPEIIVG